MANIQMIPNTLISKTSFLGQKKSQNLKLPLVPYTNFKQKQGCTRYHKKRNRNWANSFCPTFVLEMNYIENIFWYHDLISYLSNTPIVWRAYMQRRERIRWSLLKFLNISQSNHIKKKFTGRVEICFFKELFV